MFYGMVVMVICMTTPPAALSNFHSNGSHGNIIIMTMHSPASSHYSGTPLDWPPLGPVKVSLLEGWPHFRGEFVLKSDFFEVA